MNILLTIIALTTIVVGIFLLFALPQHYIFNTSKAKEKTKEINDTPLNPTEHIEQIRNSTHKTILKISCTLIIIGSLLITILQIASIEHHKHAITTYHPIEIKYNQPIFQGPNNKIYELTGNNKYTDTTKNHIKWTTKPNKWIYGINFIEHTEWEIVPITPKDTK